MITPIMWYEQSARSSPRPNHNHFGGRFKKMAAFGERENLVASSLQVLLPFYGEEEKEKLGHINIDFGYASKPNFCPIDFQLLNLIYLFL